MELYKCNYLAAEKLAYLIARDLQSAYDRPADAALEMRRIRNKVDNLKFFFERSMLNNWSEVYISHARSQIVGCCVLSMVNETEGLHIVGEIEGNYICRRYRRESFGSRNLAFMEHRLGVLGHDKVCIWVLCDNLELQNYYIKHGYTPDGKMRNVLCNAWLKECRFTKWLPVAYKAGCKTKLVKAPAHSAGISDVYMLK